MNKETELLIHIINDAIEIGTINENGLTEERRTEGTKKLKKLIHDLEKDKYILNNMDQEDEED